MFVRFFGLRSLFENSEKFGIPECESQLIFFFLAWKFELNNYRNSPKKLVRNRKKVHFLNSQKDVLRTGKSFPKLFFYDFFQFFESKKLDKRNEYITEYEIIKNKITMNVKLACNFVRIFVSRVKCMFLRIFSLNSLLKITFLFNLLIR